MTILPKFVKKEVIFHFHAPTEFAKTLPEDFLMCQKGRYKIFR
jgi:hypothetical protein